MVTLALHRHTSSLTCNLLWMSHLLRVNILGQRTYRVREDQLIQRHRMAIEEGRLAHPGFYQKHHLMHAVYHVEDVHVLTSHAYIPNNRTVNYRSYRVTGQSQPNTSREHARRSPRREASPISATSKGSTTALQFRNFEFNPEKKVESPNSSDTRMVQEHPRKRLSPRNSSVRHRRRNSIRDQSPSAREQDRRLVADSKESSSENEIIEMELGKKDSTVLLFSRKPEEKIRNPERVNLDRRNLNECPILKDEERLKLLNYQYNNIRVIKHLENLPNLIFLDLYNNKVEVSFHSFWLHLKRDISIKDKNCTQSSRHIC